MKKFRKIFLIVFSGLLFVLTVFLGINIQDKECMNSIRFVTNIGDTQESIYLHLSDGTYYAFLPSYVNLEETRIEIDLDYSITINNKSRSENEFCSDLRLNNEYRIQLSNFLGITVADETLVIMQSKNIPSFSIGLSDGSLEEIHADKNISKKGYLLAVESNKNVNYAGSFISFHGRGSSSWAQEKKPYTIEFEEDVSLLGMDKGKKWVLISNAYDESSLRNKLVYETAKEIGVNYAIDSMFVDLYVNGHYMGLYLLCEKIEVSDTRVNIQNLQEQTQQINSSPLSSFYKFEEENNGKLRKGFDILNDPEDISGGYLLQIDNHDVYEVEPSFFYTDTTPFVVSSPKYATKKQIEYISDYFITAEKEITEGDLSKIDVDSFVKYYLIMEFFANVDNCSIFFVKDTDSVNGKIVAGPVWDYDLSIGNTWEKMDSDPKTLYAKRVNWFEFLYKNEVFMDLLKDKYSSYFKPWIGTFVKEKLAEYKDLMVCSFNMDKIRWKSVENKVNSVNKSQQRFNTLDEHIKRIEDFLTIRSNHLYALWIEEKEFCTVSFSLPSHYTKNYVIELGEIFDKVPTLDLIQEENGQFLGWFDDHGKQFVPGRRITKDESYVAKWNIPDNSDSELSAVNDDPESNSLLNEMFEEIIRGEIEVLLFVLIGIIVLSIVSADVFNEIKKRSKKK